MARKNVMANVAGFRKTVRAAGGAYGKSAQQQAKARISNLKDDAYNIYIPKEFRKDQLRAVRLADQYAHQRKSRGKIK